MTHSVRARSLVQEFEGFSPSAYHDQKGIATIAYGHTAGVKMGDTCNMAQAEAWLDADMSAAEFCINRMVKIELSQDQFDALCSFVFNVGCGNFSTSTMLRLINRADWVQAALEFPKWVRAGSEVSQGLVRRRNAEKELFEKGA